MVMDGMDNMDLMDGARLEIVHVGHEVHDGCPGRMMPALQANPGVDTGGLHRYARGMSDSVNHRDGCANAGEPGTVGGFLAAALNMEDQISQGMYEEYMARARWPAGLDDKTFKQIQERLTTLVEDTKKHSKILQALIKDHAKSK